MINCIDSQFRMPIVNFEPMGLTLTNFYTLFSPSARGILVVFPFKLLRVRPCYVDDAKVINSIVKILSKVI